MKVYILTYSTDGCTEIKSVYSDPVIARGICDAHNNTSSTSWLNDKGETIFSVFEWSVEEHEVI